MSPIKDTSAYPQNWKKIREQILIRAENRCECLGECGKQHGYNDGTKSREIRCCEVHGERPEHFLGKRVILTTAHLDHDASAGDHTPENLKAMCQACHLRYDGKHRRGELLKQTETNQEVLF